MSEQATYAEHVYQEYSHADLFEPLHQREEIVRCEDCRFFDTKQCKSQWPFRLDGFCAWAERRER